MEKSEQVIVKHDAKEDNMLYAALKLIQCLYNKGMIEQHIYKNLSPHFPHHTQPPPVA